ncbi:MAG TPA: hypothetical protein VIL69_22135 [Roseomonas sp.]|jgi:hypothetical protein
MDDFWAMDMVPQKLAPSSEHSGVEEPSPDRIDIGGRPHVKNIGYAQTFTVRNLAANTSWVDEANIIPFRFRKDEPRPEWKFNRVLNGTATLNRDTLTLQNRYKKARALHVGLHPVPEGARASIKFTPSNWELGLEAAWWIHVFLPESIFEGVWAEVRLGRANAMALVLELDLHADETRQKRKTLTDRIDWYLLNDEHGGIAHGHVRSVAPHWEPPTSAATPRAGSDAEPSTTPQRDRNVEPPSVQQPGADILRPIGRALWMITWLLAVLLAFQIFRAYGTAALLAAYPAG